MQIVEAPREEKRERNYGNLKLYLPCVERFRRSHPSFELFLFHRFSFLVPDDVSTFFLFFIVLPELPQVSVLKFDFSVFLHS